MAHFVFMLTHDDRTVDDAAEIMPTLADTGLRYVGFKDVGADLAKQRELVSLAHDAGFEVMLEVVSTSKEAEMSSLRSAAQAGFDWVLGGTHGAETAGMLPDGVQVLPVPGKVVDHPSVLLGSIDEIAADAERLTALDHVSGLDLLAYRHPTADILELIRRVTASSSGPGDRRGIHRHHRARHRRRRCGRMGLHHRKRDLRRSASGGAVDRGPGTKRPRRDRVGSRCMPGAPRRLVKCPGALCSPTGCVTSCWRR